jgi:hypothetical protein
LATFFGVAARLSFACARSIDNETPCCPDQPTESSVVHAKVAATTAIFPGLICVSPLLTATKGSAPWSRGKTLQQKLSSSSASTNCVVPAKAGTHTALCYQ